MADSKALQAGLWAAAALLMILLLGSFNGNGTWMGGLGMGWMMAIPVLVVAAAVYVAYRYGRLEQKVEHLDQRKGPNPP